jgi:hypothetical protein
VWRIARNFTLQDKIIFEILPIGSRHGELKVSDLNAEIMERLPKSMRSGARKRNMTPTALPR